MSLKDRFLGAWNVFRSPEANGIKNRLDYGLSSGFQPDRPRLTMGNERSIIAAVYTRMAVDVSQVKIRHVKKNDKDHFEKVIKSSIDNLFNVEANKDQTGTAFKKNIIINLLNEGATALVPVDTGDDIFDDHGVLEINSVRVATITEWYPDYVRVYIYNDRTGDKEWVIVPKSDVVIIENPFYEVMNEINTLVRRVVTKLNQLDAVDEQISSGKLDIIFKLPFPIRNEVQRAKALARRKELEKQLAGSKYGLAYIDSTEQFNQLNRPAENNMLSSVEYLWDMLHSQLGITKSVMDGSASEPEMLNYYTRSINPLLDSITDGVRRTWLTKAARANNQDIMWFRDVFKLTPIKEIGSIADSFTRNEIASTNEFRSIIGWEPSNQPGADDLRNKNLNQPDNGPAPEPPKPKEDNNE